MTSIMREKMKYYIYVSKTKIDMLYPQIPQGIKSKIAAELSIDLKLLKASLKREDPKDTLYSKLKIVVDYIENHMDVGSVDSPREYFKGVLPMCWGPHGQGLEPIDKGKVVYFGGWTDRTILGLGGSLKHVIGSTDAVSPDSSHSLTPFLLAALYEELKLRKLKRYYEDIMSDPKFREDRKAREYYTLLAVSESTRYIAGPMQHLEFLAKRLLEGEIENMHVLLGTPIYVALAD